MRTSSRSFALASRLSIAVLVGLVPTLGLGSSVASSVAFAQTADPSLQAAHARFAEGVAFFDKGQFENARAAFLQAYALHKHPAVLMNLAQSSLRSGHTLDADRFFLRYVHESAALSPAQRAEAEKGLAEARKQLGRIDVTAPAGVAVTIDGEVAGLDGPATLDVEPGTHVVKGGTESTTVTVAAGQSTLVRLGKSSPAVVAPAVVDPNAAPGVTPTETPPSDVAPPPPEHPAGPDDGHFVKPETMWPAWLGVGGLSVSVVGFATAIAFGAFKSSAQNSYNGEVNNIKNAVGPAHSSTACTHPTNASLIAGCNQVTSDGNDVNSDAKAANVGIGFGVAGAAVAAFGLGWYLFAPREQASAPKTSLHVDPSIGPRSGGLSLGASF